MANLDAGAGWLEWQDRDFAGLAGERIVRRL
jgi:hypothetical protein